MVPFYKFWRRTMFEKYKSNIGKYRLDFFLYLGQGRI